MEHRLQKAHFGVAQAAFFIGTAMALMQALSRANLPLPGRTPQMYYLSMTAHGVLLALVFTTFFIMGLGYLFARTALGRLAGERLAWISFWVAVAGTLITTVAILSGTSTVLYTFYPPLQAHPAFYIGATLLIVGSWGWCAVMILSYRAFRRESPERPVPLAMHGILATVIVWLLATFGLAVEVLGMLIPWSLGLVEKIDPVLARTFFWWFGHPLVYFWLLPAYAVWYTILPSRAGGRLFSDPLGRMVFILFILLSTPVGFHHQFMDPGISAGWKLLHTVNTYAILYPSFITAFTIVASLEVAGRLKGAKGLFNWIRELPWGDPFFDSVVLAMLLFTFGGFGGAVNAAYSMNAMVHNTAWIHGHFHITVGSTVTMTFMGVTYWLLPRLTGRELKFRAAAQVQPYLWFFGMLLFGGVNHITGILGMPRRVYEFGYQGAWAARAWAPWTTLTAVGGVLLYTSAVCYLLVVAGTLIWGRRLEKPPAIEYAVALEPVERRGIWDRLGLWSVVAVVLIAIAYFWPIAHLLSLERFGSPGFSPF